MVNDFDLAMKHKLKTVFSNVQSAPIDLLYNVAYDLTDSNGVSLEFPLVNIYRPSGFELLPEQNFFAKRRGIEFYYNSETSVSRLARIIYARLPYQIDIYAKTFESLNKITEEIIRMFDLSNTIVVSQGDKGLGGLQMDDKNTLSYTNYLADVELHPTRYFTATYDIKFMGGPIEQSEFQNSDRVYHYVLTYDIPRAMLLDFKSSKNITTVDIGLEVDDEVI